MLLSFTRYDPGLNLNYLLMRGCYQYAGTESPMLFLPSGSSHTFSLGMPTTASLSGLSFTGQAVMFMFIPGINSRDAVTSNGLALQLGLR